MTEQEGMTLEEALRSIADEVDLPKDTPLEIITPEDMLEGWAIANRPYPEKIIGIYPSEETAREKLADMRILYGDAFHIYRVRFTVEFVDKK